MIECVFTVDYEIYGNGEGSLRELVYEPAEKLAAIFRGWNAPLVAFIEVAELEMIEAAKTDPAIDLVKNQIQNFYRSGFELGLHLHPQWYNGRSHNGSWLLDHSEYNLCSLPRERIAQILNRSIAYFRKVLGVEDFTPVSFRAGNWLFQPTRTAASVLAELGLKIDSSVFKGGVQHLHNLDYRRALRNGYYWAFTDHVEVADPTGHFLEVPIFTQMVPIWEMLTAKRIAGGVGLNQKGSSAIQTGIKRFYRLLDFLRLWQPLKLDFCRMTRDQMTRMMDTVIHEDQRDPASFRPVVAIGHTKDLVDFDLVEQFLSYLRGKGIAVSTLEGVHCRCKPERKAETSDESSTDRY